MAGYHLKIYEAVFYLDHYDVLLGWKTLTNFGITACFKNNTWYLEQDNQCIVLPITYVLSSNDDPFNETYLFETFIDNLAQNEFLSNSQHHKISALFKWYPGLIAKDNVSLPLSNAALHLIDTEDAKPVRFLTYCLAQNQDALCKKKLRKCLNKS